MATTMTTKTTTRSLRASQRIQHSEGRRPSGRSTGKPRDCVPWAFLVLKRWFREGKTDIFSQETPSCSGVILLQGP